MNINLLGYSRTILAGIIAGMALSACSGSSFNLAPESATTPYRGNPGQPAIASGTGDFGTTPDPSMPIVIATPSLDPNHAYSLPELINIAQMANPVTHAAWRRAREAATAVGLAEAAYLPILSAEVLAGYAVTSATVPGIQSPLINIPPGTITTSGAQISPALTVSWLLFDFGGRDAARDAAQQLSFAANVTFNAAHQKLIFDVANAFYQYSAARSQTRIDRQTLDNAKVVQRAAKARLEQGVATTMEVAQSAQQVAQAEFDLTRATGRERMNYQLLLQAIGISPTISIRVQDLAGRPLPSIIPRDLDRLIVASLQRRPDVQAALARVKAGKAGIAGARAEFMPKVAVTGALNRVVGSYGITDSRFGEVAHLSTNQPNASVLLGIRFPIFDGGMRDARMDAATAQAAATEAEFAQLQGAAAREIVVAYDILRSSLSGYRAATALVTAANTNYEAALGYYKNGLGTLADISIAQTGLLQSQYARAQARSDAFVAAATLAFSTGQLTNAGSP